MNAHSDSTPFRIVVVDDHPIFLAGVVSILQADARFDVVGQALNAQDALKLCAELDPDGLLTDISMKQMSGIDLIHALDQLPVAPMVTVLTVAEEPDVLMRALKAGARGYVLKGVPGQELCDIMMRVCSGEVYVTPILAGEMLTEFSRDKLSDTLETLTSREQQVLELLSQGMTNKEMGEKLFLAEKTIKHHMTKILQKLHVRSRTEAALKILNMDKS